MQKENQLKKKSSITMRNISRWQFSQKSIKTKSTKKLDDKETRKKALEGVLQRTDCDNQEVFDFLQLLKRPKTTTSDDFNLLHKEDWSKVVNK